MRLVLQPFGNVPVEVVDALAISLSTLGMEVEVRSSISIPEESYDSRRGQYRAEEFMHACSHVDGDRVLGVAAVDIFAEPLKFVFGQAEMSGRTAVISVSRLADRDRARYNLRVAKEAIHELGHTFGLAHCRNPMCVMSFSNSLDDADRKGTRFCGSCEDSLPTASWPRRT